MKFKQFLNEELPLTPEQKKYYNNIATRAKYKDRYKNLFGNEDRIYLDVPGSVKINEPVALRDKLREYGVSKINYEDGTVIINKGNDSLGFKVGDKIKAVKSWDANKEIIGKSGNVKSLGSRTACIAYDSNIGGHTECSRKIGSSWNTGYECLELLDKKLELKRKEELKSKKVKGIKIEDFINRHITGNEGKLYLNMFKASPLTRGKKVIKNLKLVVSKNPEDIACMSTDKSWKSCMNLYTGSYNRYVAKDVQHGTIVAYLIDADDKNIEYPIGRIALKPYLNDKGDIYFVIPKRIYGKFTPNAIKVIKEWLDKKQKLSGFHRIHKELYLDIDEPGSVGKYISKFKKGEKVKCLGIEGFPKTKNEIGIILRTPQNIKEPYLVKFSKNVGNSTFSKLTDIWAYEKSLVKI